MTEQTPTQIETEQAPALAKLAKIRAEKEGETEAALVKLFPKRGLSHALKLLAEIKAGRVPNVSFNAL